MSNKIWSDPSLEPKRQYRWLFSFGAAGAGDTDALPSYLCRKVDKPNFTITESEHTFLNHKFYYPGRVEWAEISVTIVDPIDLDAAHVLQNVIEKAGYKLPNALNTALEPNQLTTISKDNFAGANGALGQVFVKQIDSEGEIRETWVLYNTWIKSINFGSLDYTSDELVEIEIGLRYDWAKQFHGVADQ